MRPRCVHDSGQFGLSVMAGWFTTSKTLSLALDLYSGTMLLAADGGEWATVFPDGCIPGPAVGATLFPALSGDKGACVRCNWGDDEARPLKYAAPSGEYQAVGAILKVRSSVIFFLAPACCLLSVACPPAPPPPCLKCTVWPLSP
jgi:hypothetical protein